MTTKFMNFLAMVWFLSVLISLVIEGSYIGAEENTVINALTGMRGMEIGGIVGFGVSSLEFFGGLFRLLTWDYSFYEGGYAIFRYFWLVTLSPGALWAIATIFSTGIASLLRR